MAVLVASYGAATVLGVVSWRFAPDTAVNLAINIVIVSFFAFFEEIGWRGYMLPKLETGYPRLAPALVGFLHGVWHLPLMLLTTAYNPAGNRLIVVPLFLAVLTRRWNPVRVSTQCLRQPLAGGDRAWHVQRGSRGAGGCRSRNQPDDCCVPHWGDRRVHPSRVDRRGVDPDAALHRREAR